MSGLEIVLSILLLGAVLLFVAGLCQCAAVSSEEPAPWDDPDYVPEHFDWDWPLAS